MPAPVDILVVGGGPAGLFAAFYAGMRQMSAAILDSLDVLGGQLVALYPEKYIYDVAGFPRILAKDLAARLVEQGLQYGAAVHLGQRVVRLETDESDRLFRIHTAAGEHTARSIVIAAGLGAFEPRRLALTEAARYEGRGLHYLVRHLDEFRGRRVAVIGGGDTAVDWANALAPLAAQLTLVHRRDVFRAHEESVQRLREGPARLILFHELAELGGEDRLRWIRIQDNRSNDSSSLEVDDVLVSIGFLSSLGPIRDWGLQLAGGQIVVDQQMRTSRLGIFAAGDIAAYPGKLKLIATGFAEAAIAVNHAKTWLDPAARLFPGHSSEMKR